MNNFKRALVLLLACLMLMAMLLPALTSCQTPDTPDDPENPPSGDTPGGNTPGGNDNPGTSQTQSYTIRVKSQGGILMKGVNVFIYADSALSDLKGYGTTDENGVATIALPAATGYHAVLSSGVPQGYNKEASYAITGNSLDITLTSSLIMDNKQPSSYKVGDIMHDFSMLTADGKTFTLSEVLKEKDAVLLNFWFASCDPCRIEFPFMMSAYEKFKGDIEILAINPRDDATTFGMGLSSLGLTMPAANVAETNAVKMAFGVDAYPTSVLIDRYGAICLIEEGSLPAEQPFSLMFQHVTAEPYQQKLFYDINELLPEEKPDVQMPSSDEIGAVLDGGRVEATYSPETNPKDAEFSWPFVINGEKVQGVDCIRPSNSSVLHNNGMSFHNSYATLYATIHLKAGDVLALDYFSSCESGGESLIVLVDGKDIYQISGVSESWKTCYAFVATTEGDYEVALCYVKDGSTHVGDDTVYLSNLRVLTKSDITSATYIPRYAATNMIEGGGGYENYADVYFNTEDGYYHVGSVNGPLLLVDLMGTTLFAPKDSIYNMAYNGEITYNGVNYYDQIVKYCSFASNSELYGMCTVNAELAELLKIVAKVKGVLPTENTWLELCEYYDAYGTTQQLSDPIRGLSVFSAFPTAESTADIPFPNKITYNRVIMPRGLLYEFVPTKSGAYRITSKSQWEVNGWIFNENNEIIYTHEGGERLWRDEDGTGDLSMVYYMEAGKAYYINIAFYDVYQYGDIYFALEFMGESYDLFTLASQGFFTYEESVIEGEINEILAGGIEVALNPETGYYHHKLPDGSFGSILYLDVIGYSHIFGDKDMNELLAAGSFNFGYSENDQFIITFKNTYGAEWLDKLKVYWGEDYEENYAIYKVDEVVAGIYHGTPNSDYTEQMRTLLAGAYTVENAPSAELVGCLAVNAELAAILQKLMDKYTFEGVENSFTKLCYYYQHFGPAAD
ncbi:MAG: redoxin domain-containing protein [Clostridia bacterium]|nr:redoxin domain-containing protein [Clostridia bacterium]